MNAFLLAALSSLVTFGVVYLFKKLVLDAPRPVPVPLRARRVRPERRTHH